MNMSINFRYIIPVLTSILGLCTACSEDISVLRTPDNDSGLTLYVPDINNFKTRSSNETEVEELKYTSLFFFAFPIDGSAPTIKSLSLKNPPLSFQDTYRKYPIELAHGKYRFYLVANIYNANDYISALPQTEDELKEALFQIPDGFACQISETGLPMSATHTDFFIKDSNDSLPIASDGYNHDGKGGSLYAVLSFLYAKITVIPNDAFGNSARLSDVTFSNLSTKEPIFYEDNFEEYGNKDISLPYNEEAKIPASHTFYIPERYVAETDAVSQSSLNFKIGEKKITLPLGETESDTENKSQIVPTADTHRKIVRGTHYKYTLNTLLVDMKLEISDWSPEEITEKIKSPVVYLHVEKQEYPVSAGEVTEIWFKSDAEDVYIESPTYSLNAEDSLKKEDIPLYNYTKEYSSETKEGIFKISVNERIPSSEYEKILKETDKYDFFHIVAGSIHKRIKVTPLTLEYYLDVTPTNIPIDVSLRIASSNYEGDIPITIHTNYPTINVSLPTDGEWSSIHETSDAYLKLVSPDNTEVTENNSGSTSVGSSGAVTYNIKFKGLNTGSDIWKSNKTLKLEVMGSDGDVTSSSITVTVNIIPLIQNYKIHFKAEGWNNPHIYVYECLEFPADWNGTYSPGDGQPAETLASKPLGYLDGYTNHEPQYVAALEYSFTGAIAFNGWDVPTNLDVLYYSNGSPKPFDGYKAQGFFIFNDEQDTWNINKENQATARYSYEMDFCKQHREEIKDRCPDCTSNMNRLWPGIMMKDEGDGWYEFNLTDIAIPGRALIMFADGHIGNNTSRYPGPYEVGIPLFDYPSKEGWLLYNGVMSDRINNQFSSTKPIQ